MAVALITGAGRGIGLRTARAFLDEGWTVLALDKDFSACDLPDAVRRVQYDLTDVAGIGLLAGTLGRIDTLVNNAGVLYCEPYDAIPDAHRRC